MQAKVITVDGNIAVGKTTWINLMETHLKSKGLKVFVVKEPVDKWLEVGILQKFYKNKRKYAFSFQTFVVISRIQAIIEAWKEHGDNIDVYILERSCFTDAIFAQLNYERQDINEIEYRMYEQWRDFHSSLMPFEVGYRVYLHCTPEECYHRSLERSRDGEDKIPQEYLRDLARLHDNFFSDKAHFAWDTSRNYLNNEEERDVMCSEFLRYIGL